MDERIMGAVQAYGLAMSREGSRVRNTTSMDDATKALAQIRALVARADAAERLANAADAMEGSYRRHRSENGGSADEHQEALGVFMAALEAWREVGNV